MSFSSAKSRPTFTFDALLQLKDAGLVAASGAAQVAAAAKVCDVGTGLFEGQAVIDVTALEIDTGNEGYRIGIEGSTTPGFSSGTEVELASLLLGHSSVTGGDNSSPAGRYTLPFSNREVDGVCYRYIRMFVTVQGTIVSGINFTAFIAK